ncbi:dTDP-4-dehydrorhamnose 3,5-epimerase family protein [Acinetobacter soli]
MKITDTLLDGVKVFEPQVFGDHRGWFTETFNQSVLIENRIDISNNVSVIFILSLF